MVSITEALNNELLPYALLAIAAAILIHVLIGAVTKPAAPPPAAEEEDEPDPPRDFTLQQLRKYDGVVDEAAPKHSPDNQGKIYVAIKTFVYDVTEAKDFYGPGEAYHCFAGRDASRALAKLSFEEAELANGDLSDLSAAELDQLGDWVGKFEMKRYPVVGRLVEPPPCREMGLEELSEFTGVGPAPEGRACPPLYVGCAGKVFDVAFGGFEMYKPGQGYHVFAGRDSSRALALMSLKPEDAASRELGDLTEAQLAVLADWADRFEHKKLYPVVGTLPPP